MILLELGKGTPEEIDLQTRYLYAIAQPFVAQRMGLTRAGGASVQDLIRRALVK